LNIKIKNILNSIYDGVFPIFCVSCGIEGYWLCGDCQKNIVLDIHTFDFSHVEHIPIEEVITLFSHTDIVIEKLLEHYKYNFIDEIKEVFGMWITKAFIEKKDKYAHIDYVVAVPLHRRRYAERGFNQSDFLAQAISQVLNKPIFTNVIRRKNTLQQAKLSREKRFKNVDNAFVVSGDIVNKNILLIDDVFTTGATLFSLAHAFRDCGAGRIHGFTFSRGAK
jgi:competence protein ComFC